MGEAAIEFLVALAIVAFVLFVAHLSGCEVLQR